MAKDKKTPSGNMIYQRSSSQAHRVFGFDTDLNTGGGQIIGAPRQKYLFLVRFMRGAGEGTKSTWEDGISFAVKTFERPRVTIETQTLNQYNKKRVIQTGIKYGPVRLEFHDTSDQQVMQMWSDYASFYFGDFRKATQGDWDYDITNPDFKNVGKEGFGLTLPSEQVTEANRNSPKGFFSTLECYQFSGGFFTQFDLVNPKISNFSPDDMDYGSDVGHGLNMTLEYEAIIYHNQNKPVSMTASDAPDFIQKLQGDRLFNGDVHEPVDTSQPSVASRFNTKRDTSNLSQGGVGSLFGKNQFTNILNNAAQNILNKKLPASAKSALGSFGKFDFSSASALANSVVTQPGLLQSVQSGNLQGIKQQALATVVNAARNPLQNAVGGISASLYDIAKNSAQRITNTGGNTTNSSQVFSKSTLNSTNIGTMTFIGLPDPGADDWV